MAGQRRAVLSPERADVDALPWEKFDSRKDRWYGPDRHYWFRTDISVPESFDGKALWLIFASLRLRDVHFSPLRQGWKPPLYPSVERRAIQAYRSIGAGNVLATLSQWLFYIFTKLQTLLYSVEVWNMLSPKSAKNRNDLLPQSGRSGRPFFYRLFLRRGSASKRMPFQL